MKILQMKVEAIVGMDVFDENGQYMGSIPQPAVAPDLETALKWIVQLKAKQEAEDLCMKTGSMNSSTHS